MPLLNYTTQIDAWKTLSEIQQLLAKAGATHFSVRNDGADPVGLAFTIDFKGDPLNFSLPCKVKHLRALLQDKEHQRNLRGEQKTNPGKHALAVGWKIVYDWIKAQTALIEVEMVTIEEVFMPYLVVNGQGQTLSDKMLNGGGMKLLKF